MVWPRIPSNNTDKHFGNAFETLRSKDERREVPMFTKCLIIAALLTRVAVPAAAAQLADEALSSDARLTLFKAVADAVRQH